MPADIFPDVGGVEVEVVVDPAPVADRRVLVPLRVSVRVRRAALEPDARDRGDVRHARRRSRRPGRPARKEHRGAARARREAARQGSARATAAGATSSACTSDPYVTQQVLSALAAQQVRRRVRSTRRSRYVTRVADARRSRASRTARPRRRRSAATATSCPSRGLARGGGAQRARRRRRRRPRARSSGCTRCGDRARRVSGRREGARARAGREAGAATQAMRAKLVARPAVGDPRDRVVGDGDRDTTPRPSACCWCRTPRRPRSRSTRSSARRPSHRSITKLARGLLDARRARPLAHRPRRTSSCCRRCAATSTPTRRTTPSFTGKLWFGKAALRRAGVRRPQHARAGPRAGLVRARRPARPTTSRSPRRAPGGCTTGSASPTRPKQTDLPALDAGFVVRRAYTAVDDPGDVAAGSPTAAGRSGSARACSSRSRRSTTTRRYAVALVDPLPAGLRAGQHGARQRRARRRRHRPTAWDYTNMRDDRSEAFSMELPRGHPPVLVHRRARPRPATFVAAPAKAEEMYSPETFGRSTGPDRGDRVAAGARARSGLAETGSEAQIF